MPAPNIKFIYDEAIGLDTAKKSVITKNSEFSYDKLLIATGSSTYIPTTFEKILDLKNVFLFNTADDIIKLKNYLDKVSKPINCIVIGAGITGLEIANALAQKNINVTIIEKYKFGHLLQQQLGGKLKVLLEKQGIKILEDCAILNFEIIEDNLQSIIVNDLQIQTDIMICATGTKPNTHWLKTSKLKLQNGHIITDDFLMTNVKDVFAAGDCALVKNVVNGENAKSYLWADAVIQGFVASNNMAGKATKYNGILANVTTNINSQNVVIYGDCDNKKNIIEEQNNKYYKGICFNNDQTVSGCFSISFDNISEIGKFKNYIIQRKTLESFISENQPLQNEDVRKYVEK